MFGVQGVGKSTIANCLLKQSGQMDSIDFGGFNVSDSFHPDKFKILSNERFNIIDTIGFGCPEFNQSYIISEMRSVLAAVDNKIDHILFVVQQGRIHEEVHDFVRSVQQNVLRNKRSHNSALIVNKCYSPGWLNRPEKRENRRLQLILQSVGHSAHEFELKMDDPRDDDTDKARNRVYRQESIDALVALIEKLENPHGSLIIDHIQTREFERSFLSRSSIFNFVFSFFGWISHLMYYINALNR